MLCALPLVGPEAELDQSKHLHVNFVLMESHLLHEQLQRMYDTDFVTRTSTEEPYSFQDRHAVKLMKDTVERVKWTLSNRFTKEVR